MSLWAWKVLTIKSYRCYFFFHCLFAKGLLFLRVPAKMQTCGVTGDDTLHIRFPVTTLSYPRPGTEGGLEWPVPGPVAVADEVGERRKVLGVGGDTWGCKRSPRPGWMGSPGCGRCCGNQPESLSFAWSRACVPRWQNPLSTPRTLDNQMYPKRRVFSGESLGVKEEAKFKSAQLHAAMLCAFSCPRGGGGAGPRRRQNHRDAALPHPRY